MQYEKMKKSELVEELEASRAEVDRLRKENAKDRETLPDNGLTTVKVPKQFEQIFLRAQQYVREYFSKKVEHPSEGTIEVFGERYVLVILI
jgi:hypothetical protein